MTELSTTFRAESAAIEAPFPAPPSRWGCDPLAPDAPDDEVLVTTSRRLLRLMVSSVDAGARFDRERIGHDAAAWMLAPRAMFDGQAAIEACQDLAGFQRAIVVHGLGLGLDADPGEVDALLAEEDDAVPQLVEEKGRPAPGGGPRLLSAWIDRSVSTRPAIHFCAMVTSDPSAFARRLVDRFGPDAARHAEIELGFDPTTARATAFVSGAIRDSLVLAASAPASPFAEGLDVVIEQRFAA